MNKHKQELKEIQIVIDKYNKFAIHETFGEWVNEKYKLINWTKTKLLSLLRNFSEYEIEQIKTEAWYLKTLK